MARRDSLRRRTPFRRVLPRILIVCEGTKTEPGYFEDLRQLHRRVVELELSPGGVLGYPSGSNEKRRRQRGEIG
jgi:hypothetical protein